jgi:hypothetical protein
MDTLKRLTVEQVQGYLARGVALLPYIYEDLLLQLREMEHGNKVCMLPIATFDLYHIRLRKKLIWRIEQHEAHKVKRKAA